MGAIELKAMNRSSRDLQRGLSPLSPRPVKVERQATQQTPAEAAVLAAAAKAAAKANPNP